MRLTERAIPVREAVHRHNITMLTLAASTMKSRAPTIARQCLEAADEARADLEMATRGAR